MYVLLHFFIAWKQVNHYSIEKNDDYLKTNHKRANTFLIHVYLGPYMLQTEYTVNVF